MSPIALGKRMLSPQILAIVPAVVLIVGGLLSWATNSIGPMAMVLPPCCVALLTIVALKQQPDKVAKQTSVSAQTLSAIQEQHFASLYEKRQEIYRVLSKDELALFEGRMQVGQLMSRHIKSVGPGTPAAELRRLLIENEMRHLLVCSENGDLVGVISDRDLRSMTGRTAADVMTRALFTVKPDTLVSPAVTALLDNQVSSLPVVDGNKLCGIVTTSDLLMALQCTLELMAKKLTV